MTDQEVYKLLTKIDGGYSPSKKEQRQLSSVESIKWRSISQLPKSMSMLSRLIKLDLRSTGVKDIRALSGVTTLTNLDLGFTNVNDIRALSELKMLTNLSLGNTKVNDISALSGLTSLTKLDLGQTNVNEISALSELTALTNLDLGFTNVKEIRALSGLTSLTKLDLRSKGVTDIRALSDLTALTNLNLKYANVKDISALSGLTSLTYLYLGGTKVSEISALSGLTKLTILDLDDTNVEDISALSGLTEITNLALKYTNVKDISALSGLTMLTKLDLGGTKVSDIRALSGLTSLTNLCLGGTKVIQISVLSELTSLTNLDLNFTNISDISVISSLTSLTDLDLSVTDVCDVRPLSGLTSLTNLDLGYTNVNDINALSSLTNLTKLDLRDLTISSLPESLLDLDLDFNSDEFPEGPGIYIHGLTLTDQPIEIFSQDRELIRAYYRDHDMVPVNECKVVFLGDPEAGKTHSIKRLLEKGEKLKEFENQSTPGIEITVDTMQLENSDIVVNYWDFGGQEIQHSMHRMFLTERTIYVVFLNARQDPLDDRARYWLDNINSFAKDAPVLLVINKMDQNERPKFNEDGISSDYKCIKKIVRMSALEDEPNIFMSKLQGSINEIIREMPTVSSKVPRSWKKLMEIIRTMSDHYLTTDEFKKCCSTCHVRDYDTIHDKLVDLFQTIGISFCYYKNRALADYMLLNPKWMVNAIYTIISNSSKVANNGVITQENLFDLLQKDTLNGSPVRRVVPNLRYKGYEVNYILGVIRMFHLSYPMKDESEFFPMLCDGNEKISVHEVMSENALHYIFRYTYLPANVMHRLVVEMQRDLDDRFVWYSGAVFRNEYQQQTAYIHTKGNNLHIYVDSRDSYYNPNEYLSPIQSIVRAINSDMNLSADEYVTCREGDKEAEIKAKNLKGNLEAGIERAYIEELNGIVDYRDIARRYSDICPKIKDDLLPNIIKALGLMQNEKAYYKTSENSNELEDFRNRYVSYQILMAGYNCNDQQPGGLGEGEKRTGERDIVFRNKNGKDILVFEGLNLSGFSAKNIKDHLHKLMVNYNPQGLPYGALVSYVDCDRTRFNTIADGYREHISHYAPEKYACVGQPRNIPTIGQYLKCLEMDYECGGQFFTIYHILVGMVQQ